MPILISVTAVVFVMMVLVAYIKSKPVTFNQLNFHLFHEESSSGYMEIPPESERQGFIIWGKAAEEIFPNDWGLSIIRHYGSYGAYSGLYEIAVLKVDRSDNAYHMTPIHYDNPVANGDVVGYLTEQEVEAYLNQVRKFKV